MSQAAGMSIGDLAASTGETVKTLRYWSDLGLLTCDRSPSGYRQFPPSAGEEAGFIRSAQAVGFSLDEIHTIMAARAGGEKPCRHVKSALQAHLESVRAHITRLQALEAQLQAKVEWADTHPDPECDSPGCVFLEPAPDA